jgi:hypothetical protein
VVLPTVAAVAAGLAAHLVLARFTDILIDKEGQFNLVTFDLDSWAVEPLLVRANSACDLGAHS